MAKKKAYDYEAMEQQLEGRTSESYDTKESSGTRQMALELPSGYELWNATEGTHYIDIIPFFAGGQHPQCNEGEATYVLDYWVHNNVGPAKETVVCPEKTLSYRGTPGHLVEAYGRRCPICEHRNKLIDEGADPKDKHIKALKAKRRVAYNMVCYDSNKEIDKGVQVWEVSHFFAEKNIVSISKSERTGGIIPFSSPRKERGRTVKFEKAGKGENVAYQGFVLEPRDYDIDPEILEAALSLDEYLVYLDYAAIKEKFFDGLDEGDEEEIQEERKPGRVRGGRPAAKEAAFDPEAEDEGTQQAGDDDAPPPPLEEEEEDQPPQKKSPPARRGAAPAPKEEPAARKPAPRGAQQPPAKSAPPARTGGAPVRRRPAQDAED